jgi:parallel beta-helix repeat protein
MKRLSYFIIAFLLGIVFQSQAQLSGDYTIGATGTYTTFNEAVAAIGANGVNGPVIFIIESGTYNEQVVIPEINGASDVNTITFQSASGDSTDVILTYESSDEINNYTLKLDGADFIIFKDITLAATGANYARVVEIGLRANSNTFSNNRLLGVLNKSELVYANSSQDTSNVFNKNVFLHGIQGINMTSGLQTETPAITITANEFIDQTEKAIYLKSYEHPVILFNNIHSDYEYTGIQLDTNRDKVEVGNNEIYLPNGGVGIELDFGQWTNTNDTSFVYNNYIYLNSPVEGNPDYGVSLNNNSLEVKILFNTVHIVGNNTYGACLYKIGDFNTYLINNNLVNKANGYAIKFDNTSLRQSDYNNLFTTGTRITTYATDLIDWQTNYRDINSISVDPYFVTETGYLVLNPALNGAGIPFAEVSKDIDGDIRDVTNPDIGVDEFTPAPTPIQGAFTIGGASPDYASIYKSVEDLVVNGVNGPVVFNIATGTYTEQVIIPQIDGASETNTITFQSATGDSTDVIITNSPNSTNKHTIQLNGADYLRFKNLSITTTEEWGWPVELKSEATHNLFEGNKIYLATQASKNDSYALIYAKGSADSSNVFIGNFFENGSSGIYLEGSGSGTRIINNEFINISYHGIYLRGNISPEVTGNRIRISTTYEYTDGIYLRSAASLDENRALIANNMIIINSTASKARGINNLNFSDASFLYNTIKINTDGSDSYTNAFYGDGNNFDILNNIFVLNQGGFSASVTDTTNCVIDYNLYYHPNQSSGDMYYSTGHTTNLEQYGYDLNSFTKEPVFVSETDLHTTDPWMSDKGTPLANITTDIDGELRSAIHPDVGADEYVADVLFAGDFTIGPSGDFANFSEAVDSIMQVGVSGDVTFHAASGTYNEQFIIGEIPFISDTRKVNFKPEIPGDSTVILGFAATASDNYIIRLDSADYVTLTGFTFKALDPENSRIIELKNEATHNVISNNIFLGNGAEGPIIYSGDGQDDENYIIDNKFYDGNYAIFMLGESSGSLESGLVIKNNLFNNQSKGSIYLKYQSESLVEGSKIKHPTSTTDYFGIFISESTNTAIVNNELSINAEGQSSGIVLDNANQANTYFNSVYMYGTASDSRSYNNQGGGQNNTLYNNILVNEATGLAMYNTEVTSFSSDNNNFYTSDDRFIYTDTWIPDLATWQSISGQGAHSYATNPDFTKEDPLETSNPLLNGSAIPIAGVITDINGTTRDSTNPDIGAYEYSEAEFVLGADTTICINTSIILDAGEGYDSYLWSTGEATQTIETNIFNKTDSSYSVIVMHNTTEYTDNLTVSYTGPTVALPDTTAFCTGQNIQLIAGSGDNDYLWSTGSMDPSITVDAVGTYTVKVTDAQGCFERDTTEVLESSGPDINLGGTAEFCNGDTLRIDAGAGDNYTYLWSNDSTTQILEVTAGGNYEVNVVDKYGCANSDNISITEHALPEIDLGEDRTICEGSSLLLDAGSGFSSYLWNDNTTDQTITVFATGEYIVEVTNANSCVNSDTVNVMPFEPFEVLITYSNNVLSTEDHSGFMYSWFFNGTLVSSGVNAFSYSPTESGEYWLEVENEHGCRSASNVLNISVLAIEDSGPGAFKVYPNPTAGRFKINFENNITNADIFIFNTDGKLIYQNTGISNPGIKEYEINLKGIPEGLYLLKVNIDGTVYDQKILLKLK